MSTFAINWPTTSLSIFSVMRAKGCKKKNEPSLKPWMAVQMGTVFKGTCERRLRDISKQRAAHNTLMGRA